MSIEPHALTALELKALRQCRGFKQVFRTLFFRRLPFQVPFAKITGIPVLQLVYQFKRRFADIKNRILYCTADAQ